MNADCVIALLDDDPAVLASLQALLTAHGYPAHRFEAPEDFLETCPLDAVGCVVTDLRMPGIDGSELQQRLLAAGSTLSMIVVTGHADVPTAVRLMANGAITLLEKPYEESDLIQAVQLAIDRSQSLYTTRQRRAEIAHRLSKLTGEERQVMGRLLKDEANKTIGFELGISLRTVDRRRKAVLEKMRVDSLPELAAMLAQREPTDWPVLSAGVPAT